MYTDRGNSPAIFEHQNRLLSLPTTEILINAPGLNWDSTARPFPPLRCSPSLSRCFNMPYTPGPVVSPSTALGMGEHLISLLDTIIQNLPEKELRKIRSAMAESISLADLVLENLSVSSTFDMLTVNDGART